MFAAFSDLALKHTQEQNIQPISYYDTSGLNGGTVTINGPEHGYGPDSIQENSEKLFRKYYGKRVTKLTSRDQFSSPFPPNRFKLLKNFEARGFKLTQRPSQSIKRLSFEDFGDIKESKIVSSIMESISQYKHLTTLFVPMYEYSMMERALFLKNVRKLPNLQSFTTFLTMPQLVLNMDLLLSLSTLKAMKITILNIDSGRNNSAQSEIFKPCLKLFGSKTLQFLELNFQYFPQYSLTYDIIQALHQATIPSFHLRLKVDISSSLNFEAFSNALNDIDLFTIKDFNGYETQFTCSTYRTPNVTMSQAKRRVLLEINIPKSSLSTPSSEISEMQENLPLKHTKELLMKFYRFPEGLIPGGNNIKCLKSLSLDMNRIFSTPVVEAVTNVIKHTSDLEHLNLSSVSQTFYSKPTFEIFQSLFTEISKLTKLETLIIADFTLTREMIDIITYPVPFLKNLKKFRLGVSIQSLLPLELPFSIEFPESSKLTEFLIVLPDLNAESQANFMKATAKLTNLQGLVLTNGSQLFTQQVSRDRFKDMLTSLPSLRDLVVQMNAPQPIPKQYPVQSESERNTIALELRDIAKSLMRKNKGLERIVIDDRAYDIVHERY